MSQATWLFIINVLPTICILCSYLPLRIDLGATCMLSFQHHTLPAFHAYDRSGSTFIHPHHTVSPCALSLPSPTSLVLYTCMSFLFYFIRKKGCQVLNLRHRLYLNGLLLLGYGLWCIYMCIYMYVF